MEIAGKIRPITRPKKNSYQHPIPLAAPNKLATKLTR
jgi:hypothetical protein